jgi:hypothetical protein
VNSELEGMWKEVVVVLFCTCQEELRETNNKLLEKPIFGAKLNPGLTKYKARMISVVPRHSIAELP